MPLDLSNTHFGGQAVVGKGGAVVAGDHGGDTDDTEDAEGDGATETDEHQSWSEGGSGDKDEGSFHERISLEG